MELKWVVICDLFVFYEGVIFKDLIVFFMVFSCIGELEGGIFDNVMCCVDEECSCFVMDCVFVEEVGFGENFNERCCKRFEVDLIFIFEVVFEGGEEGILFIVLKELLYSFVIFVLGCKLLCGDIIDGIGCMLKDIFGGFLVFGVIFVLFINCIVESSIFCFSLEVLKFLIILFFCVFIRKLYGLSVGIFVKVFFV